MRRLWSVRARGQEFTDLGASGYHRSRLVELLGWEERAEKRVVRKYVVM